MKPPRLILASTSPYRKTRLAQLRIPFDALPPDVDEEGFKQRISDPRELAACPWEAIPAAVL